LCDQGLAHHEYVVAISDNCSSDRTRDVVEEYRDRLQVFYHRNPENIGQRENWRVVAALCETPYLSLLPDDDLLAPGQLGRAFSAFDAHEGAVLVSSLAVLQEYPGDPKALIVGAFLGAGARTSYSEPYVCDTTEWLALSLVRTMTPSLVGSVFRHEVFRRCKLPARYTILGDRALLAEMALHGNVLGLPWIGGYIRKGEHRDFYNRFREVYEHESALQTRDILDLCERRNLPVLEFWAEQVRHTIPRQRKLYLSELRDKLPPWAYVEIQEAVAEKLSAKPSGRLDRWSIPRHLTGPLRAVRKYLSNK
jgi:glycosyltransferase involved in cell wall biosynthesis